jgi:mRNA interferase MazF
MVINRGEVWWANIPSAKGAGSAPSGRRPVLIIQSDRFNRSRIGTVVVLSLTSNLRLGQAEGNVYLRGKLTGLERDSVVNVSQVSTLDKSALDEMICNLSATVMQQIEEGLKMVLGFDS